MTLLSLAGAWWIHQRATAVQQLARLVVLQIGRETIDDALRKM